MTKLDLIDKKLLHELDKDASQSLASLSKKLRKSKQTILYRMRRLEKAGIIQGYKTVVDMSALGFVIYRMYVKLQNTDEGLNEAIFNFFKNTSDVWSVALMQGKWDLAVFFGAKNISDLHLFFDKFIGVYKLQIKEYKLSIYQPVYFFARHFFYSKVAAEHELKYGLGVPQEHDDTDLKIIEELKNNCRIKNIEIAKKLSISLDTAIRRRRLLEKKKIILGYKLVLNYALLGYTAYRVDFALNDYTKRKQLFEYCKNHKNVYGINDTIAGADFEIALAVKDHYEFNKILNEILKEFKGVINSYDYIGFSLWSFIEYIPD